MKRRILAVCVAATVGLGAGRSLAGEAPAAASALDEVVLSVSVSDLHGWIDGVGSVAEQVSPMMSGAVLAGMVGTRVGDPGLAGIERGKGLALVALDPTNIFAVVELNAAQLPVYTNALAGLPMKYENGLLVVAATDAALSRGAALAGAVRDSLLARRSPTLRVAAKPAKIIERNEELVSGLLQTLPMQVGQNLMKTPGATLESTQEAMQMVEAELRVLFSLAGQCETVELELAPKDGSVRISETYVPKAGTPLAALASAPATRKPDPRIKPGYLGDGFMRLEAHLSNPSALIDFVVAEAQKVVREMDLSEVDPTAWAAAVRKWGEAFGGSFCESVGLGEGPLELGVSYLANVNDEAVALGLLRESVKDMAPLLEMYGEIGVSATMAFRENVREYNGIPVHQVAVSMTATNQSPEVAAELALMDLTNLVYEVALTDGRMAASLGAGSADAILKRLADDSFRPAPLAARKVFPNGGFYYFDLDVGKYVPFVLSMVPGGGASQLDQQMAALFQGVEPITSAGFKSGGRVTWSLNIPGGLIAKVGQMAMIIQMQQMAQPPASAPVPPPAAAPGPNGVSIPSTVPAPAGAGLPQP